MSTIDDLYKSVDKLSKGITVIRKASEIPTYPHVKTGIFVLDFALGGGIQENSITTIIGKQSSGKTSLTFRIISEFQKKYNGVGAPKVEYDGIVYPYKRCVFIDVENTFDPVWAAKHGVDLDKLLVLRPTDGDMAVDIACQAMRNDEVCLVVMDSIPALVTTKELEKSVEDMVIAGVAVLTQRFLRKASEAIAIGANTNNHKTLILINQWRNKAGFVMGDPRSMPGGNAPRYFVSTEIEIIRSKTIEGANEDNIAVGLLNEHSFKIMKNKTGNSITQGDFEIARINHEGYEAGEVMDAHTVYTYAGKYGYAGGGGAKYYVSDPETGDVLHSGSKGSVISEIHKDQELKARLSLACIKRMRESQGQKPNPYV